MASDALQEAHEGVGVSLSSALEPHPVDVLPHPDHLVEQTDKWGANHCLRLFNTEPPTRPVI